VATVYQLQQQRKSALRECRRRQRKADTAIEKIERRLFRLLDRKTLITEEDAMKLVPEWNDFMKQVRDLEHGLADFISITAL